MSNLKGRRVLIGTPSYDWKADIRYMHSLGLTIKLCMQRGIDVRWLFPVGLVEQSRNEIVRDALANGFDDLIFIDADQSWESEWITTLLSYDVDCVGAPIRKKDDAEILWNVKMSGGPLSFYGHPDYELLTAPDLTLGTGLLRLSRKALQLLWDASPKYRKGKEDECAWIFELRPEKGELMSEDMRMCEKLRALGVLTWVDPAMNPPHHDGRMSYVANFLQGIKTLQEAALKAKTA